ncbi:MAG: hypothetical protein ABIR46_02010 [Candidatus Saccharimonadales bacterium]
MNLFWQRLAQVVDRHRITYAVAGALLIAMLMTAVSMALYVSSGASRLDLSRPGYESARGDVQRVTNEEAFSASGPMNTEVVNDFQTRFSKHRAILQKLDTYGTNALDDTELQIAPGSTQ